MRETRSVPGQYGNAIGDAAVEGLFSGMIAGIGMAIYLGIVSLAMGEGVIEIFTRFAMEDRSTPLLGFLLHLGVSGVYGLAYGVVCQFTARRWIEPPSIWLAVVMGVFYGMILVLLAQVLLLPGSQSPLKEIPSIHLTIAHLIYGATLGILTNLEQNHIP